MTKVDVVPVSPELAVLEAVTGPESDVPYVARFTCPEFTSLCPATGLPDFGHLVIDYVPNGLLLESKAFKLFVHSFRNHGGFHEACTVLIGNRIWEAVQPQWLRVCAFWYPRGGIPIDVFWQKGDIPPEVHIQDPGVAPYRGRG